MTRRPRFVDLALSPENADDARRKLAFKWAGDCDDDLHAIALATAAYEAAWRCALAARGAEPTPPPAAVVSEAGLYGRMDGARVLAWTIGPAAAAILDSIAPERGAPPLSAPPSVALCDPALRARASAGEPALMTLIPGPPRDDWGAGSTLMYVKDGDHGREPHFADACEAVMGALSCQAIAAAVRGARGVDHAPVTAASATVRATMRHGTAAPVETLALLRRAGLGEMADEVARRAASPAGG